MNTSTIPVWELMLDASPLVMGVMVLLILASIASWAVIYRKYTMLKRTEKRAVEFEERFWSGADLNQIYDRMVHESKERSGIDAIFESGYREFSRLREEKRMHADTLSEGASRAMRVTMMRELDELENHLSFLATVGSTSPYVGLFGTVWGIMNAFRGLATQHTATIATVAPGISEALIVTAMGLFAAIPAVIAYNKFSNQVERLELRFDNFKEEFTGILHRQARKLTEAG